MKCKIKTDQIVIAEKLPHHYSQNDEDNSIEAYNDYAEFNENGRDFEIGSLCGKLTIENAVVENGPDNTKVLNNVVGYYEGAFNALAKVSGVYFEGWKVVGKVESSWGTFPSLREYIEERIKRFHVDSLELYKNHYEEESESEDDAEDDVLDVFEDSVYGNIDSFCEILSDTSEYAAKRGGTILGCVNTILDNFELEDSVISMLNAIKEEAEKVLFLSETISDTKDQIQKAALESRGEG
jgi:hypothetical protein